MQCLLLWLKSRSARKASPHADFMGNCLTVICFSILTLWTFRGKPMRVGGRGRLGAEGIVLLIFVLWCCFNRWWVRSCGLGWDRKSCLRPAKIASFSSRDLSRCNKQIHSGWLHQLDISTFYFYEPLLFQIFFPWKFITICSSLV